MRDPNEPTATKQLKGRELEKEATKLRIAGVTFQAIGDALGVSDEGARKAVKRALERTMKEIEGASDELREIERQRLESLIFAVMTAAKSGRIDAVEAARRLSESIRKLMGLDITKPPQIALINIEGLNSTLDKVYGHSNDHKS